MARTAGLLVALTLGAFSCSGSELAEPRPPAASPSGSSRPASERAPEGEKAPNDTSPDEFEVAVTDRAALSALESEGFTLGRLVFASSAMTTAELAELPGMNDVLGVLRDDLRAAKRTYPLAKVTSMDGFRLFDERWLASNETRFELIGVFNRLDRRVFYPGTCGELRFLYRLAYETEHALVAMAGRLPLTVNVVFLVKGDQNCGAVAREWQAPRNVKGAAVTAWLLGTGPLAPAARGRWELKSLETNLQSFRLQSFVHPTLAGHIDYVLRVFHAKSGTRAPFFPAPMENMPDVPALAKDPKLRAELLAYLGDPAVLAAIDRGTMNLPERFLATRAVSVSPRGLTRPANRPFRKLFRDDDIADFPLAGTRTIASPRALLRRLDGATCTGCHQSRSIAGFHHVGEDALEHPSFDALLSGSSPHLASDLARRRAYVANVANGKPTDEFRPIPERQGTGTGFGAPCGLGDPGFADWTCEKGLRCEELEDHEVGTCLTGEVVGAACQYGELVSKSEPHRDVVASMKKYACGEKQFCHDNRSGFPLGACEAACNSTASGSTCADFLDADAFQNCLRSRQTFEQCSNQHVYGAGLRACDAENPCRQDYVCVRSRTPGRGACVPPYFVYQLRLDGYPLLR